MCKHKFLLLKNYGLYKFNQWFIVFLYGKLYTYV